MGTTRAAILAVTTNVIVKPNTWNKTTGPSFISFRGLFHQLGKGWPIDSHGPYGPLKTVSCLRVLQQGDGLVSIRASAQALGRLKRSLPRRPLFRQTERNHVPTASGENGTTSKGISAHHGRVT